MKAEQALQDPLIWFEGRYVRESRARVPVSDPALGWGIGLFEIARGYGGRAFRLDAHVERLMHSARALGLRVELPDLHPVVTRLFGENGLAEGAIRITCTGGGLRFVSVKDFPRQPANRYRRGGALLVANWRRDARAPLTGHKTLNYYANMIDRSAAGAQGAVDTLIRGLGGEILEGTRANVFSVKRGRILTPSLGAGILPGVTRSVVLELAREEGIPIREGRLTLPRLEASDEVFVTSTLMEIMPIRRVGQVQLGGPGEVTRKLRRAFARRVREECS